MPRWDVHLLERAAGTEETPYTLDEPMVACRHGDVVDRVGDERAQVDPRELQSLPLIEARQQQHVADE